jgi:ABC-type nitrate/sulfonate/bicarbonate transport system substrate-binding protein
MRTNATLATIISTEEFPVARTVLTVVASLAALSSITAPAAQAEDTCAKPTTVRIQEWTGDIINIVPWVADSKDMFRKHCLDVKFVPLVAGPGAIVALVNNTIDFANQGPDNIIRSRSKGVEVKIMSNMYAGHWSALVAANGLALPHLNEGYPCNHAGSCREEDRGDRIGRHHRGLHAIGV